MRAIKLKGCFTVMFSFIFLLSFGCKTHENYPKIENYSIFKKEISNEYILLSYSNSIDSILIVSKKAKLKNCKELVIDRNDLLKIKRINKINENIGFYHNDSILTQKQGFKIKSGAFKPGAESEGKTIIYSYSGMPYLIEDCGRIK
ncbi:MAG: hypothetical protein V7719_18260 [Psychroserpens sp.]|uniref:hypothetical protein n=1 Tax=Psychroserpens sp. TaxID=2020870 RepID=UPI0030016D90